MKSELVSRNPSSGAPWKRMAAAFLLALGFVVVLAQIGGHAQPAPITLPYANSYLTTGNYVTGAVDLPGTGTVNGLATGTIHMSGVPANADILGAWLYWETIVTDPSQLAGAKFRGLDLKVVKAAARDTDRTFRIVLGRGRRRATFTMYQMRADVRRLLPLRPMPATSRRESLVGDTDLLATTTTNTGQPCGAHTVTLPDLNGNNAQSAQAPAWVVVSGYRSQRNAQKDRVLPTVPSCRTRTGVAAAAKSVASYQSVPDNAAMLTPDRRQRSAERHRPAVRDFVQGDSSFGDEPFPGASVPRTNPGPIDDQPQLLQRKLVDAGDSPRSRWLR